jgi:hypothetical protein
MNVDRTLDELLMEAVKRGFNPSIGPYTIYLPENYPHVTYKCAQKGHKCKLFYLPKKVIPKGTPQGGEEPGEEPGQSLTDGYGGYILYKGKWAENTTPSFVRKQKLDKLLK